MLPIIIGLSFILPSSLPFSNFNTPRGQTEAQIPQPTHEALKCVTHYYNLLRHLLLLYKFRLIKNTGNTYIKQETKLPLKLFYIPMTVRATSAFTIILLMIILAFVKPGCFCNFSNHLMTFFF